MDGKQHQGVEERNNLGAKSNLELLWDRLIAEGSGSKRFMKRCFMTGKECIYSSSIASTTSIEGINSRNNDDGNNEMRRPRIFVIMPFSPNLKTFYYWSLKPFLSTEYGINDEDLLRGDEVQDIGYIICEKICKQIQMSDCIFSEISINNSNVFYETGLAFGLGKPIILMRDEHASPEVLDDPCLRQSLDLNESDGNESRVLYYPGIDPLKLDYKYRLDRYVKSAKITSKRVRESGISILRVNRMNSKKEDRITLIDRPKKKDIELIFTDVLKSSVEVSMNDIRAELNKNVKDNEEKIEKIEEYINLKDEAENIKNSLENKSISKEIKEDFEKKLKENEDAQKKYEYPNEMNLEKKDRLERDLSRLKSILKLLKLESSNDNQSNKAGPDRPQESISRTRFINVDGMRKFDEVARDFESSFCTIIDVTESDSVAYFWLGYCHARGLNVIPVFRKDESKSIGKRDKLAFDIRALWYAEYDEGEPYEFKSKIREILEYLIERDLPDRQKRIFWDRFSSGRKLFVYTGAIHVGSLTREMVGDWDVRTVSELFSYLPTIRESLALDLALPIYSPIQSQYFSLSETDMKNKEKKKEFRENYRSSINEQLAKGNSIVIASPDVNPVTEYLLHKIYNVRSPKAPFESLECIKTSDNGKEVKELPNFEGYVAIKWKKVEDNVESSQVDGDPEAEKTAETQLKYALNDDEKVKYNSGEVFTESREYNMEMKDEADYKESIPIYFYDEGKSIDKKNWRGFAINKNTVRYYYKSLLKEYISQNQNQYDNEFSLLGHLVVAYYPPDARENLIVLLNGVSGPATFALAQILTGGGSSAKPNMGPKSEELLQMFNKKLDEMQDDRECSGVEAIVEIKVGMATKPSTLTYVDNRDVLSWHFVHPPKLIRPDRTTSLDESLDKSETTFKINNEPENKLERSDLSNAGHSGASS